MKEINKFIIERLKLDRSSKVNPKRVLDEAKLKDSVYKIDSYRRYEHMSDENRDWSKMEGYRKKGSKPQTLANSIKTEKKLLRRWLIAVFMDWEECYDVFRKKLIETFNWDENELDYYILNKYNNAHDSNLKSKYETYLNKYNIKID